MPQILARRALLANRFFTLVEEDIRDRNGGVYTYYQVETVYDAVIVVPLLADGRLVLERIYRHPYRRYFWEFPAGGIGKGEHPIDAARRELLEETGYQAKHLEPLGAHEAMPGLLRMRLHVVLATELVQTNTTDLDPMEWITTEEVSEAEAWSASEAEAASAFLSLGLLYLARWRSRR